MKKTYCQRCAACCKLAWTKVQLNPELASVYNCNPDGSCGHLQKEAGVYLCDIFVDRPKDCRADWVSENFAPLLGLSKDEYYELAPRVCQMLRDHIKG